MRGTTSRPTCATRPTSRAWARRRGSLTNITGARPLGQFGDSITTDHISPAGSIRKDSPAGAYLHGRRRRAPKDFNQYGTRRGNHEVMMRGTFANIRLKNEMVPGIEGGFTHHCAIGPGRADLRRGDALPQGAHAADPDRRQGIRHRQLARLGRQGRQPARREGRGVRDVRAHPSLQPGRHGRAAAAVQGRHDAQDAEPHRHARASTSAASTAA